MTRAKKALMTSISSMICQVTTVVCGFILPRCFLFYYGSSVNGLLNSITQFLGFISLAECGVGAVVRSALYKPLAERDNQQISSIVLSSDRFFKKVAYILVGYSALLMLIYPLITIDSFEFLFSMPLIAIIATNFFVQYYFGMTYRQLIFADQTGYVWYYTQIGTLVCNTVICVVLMKMGVGIHLVKLLSTSIFLFQPIFLLLYCRKKYKIDRSLVLKEEPIKQKWNGLAQHIATVVLNNTDTVVLTLLASLKDVSIYSIYHLVVNGVRLLIDAFTSGPQALFGDLYAKRELEKLEKTFTKFEWIMHTLVCVCFSITGCLILSFVQIYTRNITDANYYVPVFAILITIAQAAYCLRLPYNLIVLAAGHFKETQASAIIEAVINIVISIILVHRLGLTGVAIGTLVAMAFRTVYFAYYISKNILVRKFSIFIKRIIVDVVSVGAFLSISILILRIFDSSVLNYLEWTVLAIKTSIICGVSFLIVNIIFCRKELFEIIKYIKNRFARVS